MMPPGLLPSGRTGRKITDLNVKVNIAEACVSGFFEGRRPTNLRAQKCGAGFVVNKGLNSKSEFFVKFE